MVYKWYILPIGGLYATYHLLGEPETTLEFPLHSPHFFSEVGCPAVIHSLKLTASLPLKIGRNPKGNSSEPTIHFQVRTVSFREGIIFFPRLIESTSIRTSHVAGAVVIELRVLRLQVKQPDFFQTNKAGKLARYCC